MNLDRFVFQSTRTDSEERVERRTALTKRNLRNSNSEGGDACVECSGDVGDQLVASATRQLVDKTKKVVKIQLIDTFIISCR